MHSLSNATRRCRENERHRCRRWSLPGLYDLGGSVQSAALNLRDICIDLSCWFAGIRSSCSTFHFPSVICLCDNWSTVRDFESIVRDFESTVGNFESTVRDFESTVRDFPHCRLKTSSAHLLLPFRASIQVQEPTLGQHVVDVCLVLAAPPLDK